MTKAKIAAFPKSAVRVKVFTPEQRTTERKRAALLQKCNTRINKKRSTKEMYVLSERERKRKKEMNATTPKRALISFLTTKRGRTVRECV